MSLKQFDQFLVDLATVRQANELTKAAVQQPIQGLIVNAPEKSDQFLNVQGAAIVVKIGKPTCKRGTPV